MNHPEDYVEYLSKAGASEVALLHDFRVRFYGDTSSWHAFFESDEDRTYYMPFIRRAASDLRIQTYDCGGKPKLKLLRDDIYLHGFDKSRCVFFVDRDYDDFLDKQISADSQTYITKYYSIGSEIASIASADVLLCDLAGLNSTDVEYANIMHSFEAASSAFASRMKSLSAWLILLLREHQKPNINNMRINCFVRLDDSGIPRKQPDGFSTVRRDLGLQNAIIRIDALRKEMQQSCHGDNKLWIRGKFQLWFFREFFLIKLREIVSQNDRPTKTRLRIPPALQNNSLFEAMGGRLQCPPTLESFLRSRFMKSAK